MVIYTDLDLARAGPGIDLNRNCDRNKDRDKDRDRDRQGQRQGQGLGLGQRQGYVYGYLQDRDYGDREPIFEISCKGGWAGSREVVCRLSVFGDSRVPEKEP